MAALQQFLFNDNSVFTNYFNWASAMSAFFASCGWVQTNDTGQVMWSGMNLTAVSMSGSNATYTYNSLTGLPLAVGRAVTCTGLTNSGNNKTVVITAFTGTTSGTFTVVNAAGVTEAGSTGVVTAQTTVPGSAAYFNEIWTPNDGLTAFYVKLETGNFSGTNIPEIRVTLGSSTNGTGTLTGILTGTYTIAASATSAASSTIKYECNMSGDVSRIGFMMWRNGPGNQQRMFAIERSLNSSGTYTGTYATLYVCGYTNNTFFTSGLQQTLYFGVGATVVNTNRTNISTPTGGPFCRVYPYNSPFNQSQSFDLAAPYVGFFDYPGTMVGCYWNGILSEGIPFQATVYGSTRTYMPSAAGPFGWFVPAYNGAQNTNATCALVMRFD